MSAEDAKQRAAERAASAARRSRELADRLTQPAARRRPPAALAAEARRAGLDLPEEGGREDLER